MGFSAVISEELTLNQISFDIQLVDREQLAVVVDPHFQDPGKLLRACVLPMKFDADRHVRKTNGTPILSSIRIPRCTR